MRDMHAFTEGAIAYVSGESLEDNPYPHKCNSWCDWKDGFLTRMEVDMPNDKQPGFFEKNQGTIKVASLAIVIVAATAATYLTGHKAGWNASEVHLMDELDKIGGNPGKGTLFTIGGHTFVNTGEHGTSTKV